MTSTSEAIPVFGLKFDRLMNYLHDIDVSPASISPKRDGTVLRVDMQTLAQNAHVHRNTISRTPDAESVQHYLRKSVRVIRAATDIASSVENAIYWFKNNPLPVFDYKTPQDLVSEGRTEALVQYVQSLQAGFVG